MMQRVIVMAALMIVAACGSAPQSVVTGAPGHRDSLFEAEIDTYRAPGMTAYDLIQHLRPEYLRNRGANSLRNVTPPTAVVYLDNSKYGDLESLKSINSDMIRQVQYLSANSAQTRFGMDHTGGAILITTK